MGTTASGGNGGNGRYGGLITQLPDKLIKALPPAFLLLILINIAFLGTTMWMVNHNAEARNLMIQKILENCLTRGNN
jgi:hypothetical protein